MSNAFPVAFLNDSQLAPRSETIKCVMRGASPTSINAEQTIYIEPGSGSALTPSTDHAWAGYNRWCFSGTVQNVAAFEATTTNLELIIEIEQTGVIVAGPPPGGEWVEVDRWPLARAGLIRFEDYRLYAPIIRWSIYNPTQDDTYVLAEIKAEAR